MTLLIMAWVKLRHQTNWNRRKANFPWAVSFPSYSTPDNTFARSEKQQKLLHKEKEKLCHRKKLIYGAISARLWTLARVFPPQHANNQNRKGTRRVKWAFLLVFLPLLLHFLWEFSSGGDLVCSDVFLKCCGFLLAYLIGNKTFCRVIDFNNFNMCL